jgi:CheY-like chemotaxis protein
MNKKDQSDSNANRHFLVLVVEDELALRLIMRKQLNQFGFNVDFAEDGIAAFRQVEKKEYCLIFMDIQMPHMNGIQATAVIRNYEEEQGSAPTPIIATAAGGATKKLCLAVGMTDYLQKPVTREKLKQVLERWECKKSSCEIVD